MAEKSDRRIEKTQEKIYQALWTLCQQGVPFEAVSVRKLSDLAGISHQTFYRHYLSPAHVITTIIDSHLAEFLKEFHLQNLTAERMIHQLLKTWNRREEVFKLMEWSNLRHEFIQRLSQFNHQIAKQNGIQLIDIEPICNVYAAATYMFLRAYVLEKRWDEDRATTLLLDLTNQMDKIF